MARSARARPNFRQRLLRGTNGITSLLITSSAGHILLDVGLPDAAPIVLANIRTLGFRAQDVKVILNSHEHFDHAGGISAVQRATGARVEASAPSDSVLRRGASLPSDPQFGIGIPYPPVSNTSVIAEGDTVRVGPLALGSAPHGGAHAGGTTWSWRSCNDTGKCLDFVYADSQTPVSADAFKYTHNTTYTNALDDFAHGAAVLESLPCDVLLTPHRALRTCGSASARRHSWTPQRASGSPRLRAKRWRSASRASTRALAANSSLHVAQHIVEILQPESNVLTASRSLLPCIPLCISSFSTRNGSNP